ncbi:hypothetical protein [uncultured Duncaniella sp.]|nr:hypothetical protein [uncultured Duncaniella sp.]
MPRGASLGNSGISRKAGTSSGRVGFGGRKLEEPGLKEGRLKEPNYNL